MCYIQTHVSYMIYHNICCGNERLSMWIYIVHFIYIHDKQNQIKFSYGDNKVGYMNI